MEYINIKGLDKPISKLIMGTAWFNPAFEEEIFYNAGSICCCWRNSNRHR